MKPITFYYTTELKEIFLKESRSSYPGFELKFKRQNGGNYLIVECFMGELVSGIPELATYDMDEDEVYEELEKQVSEQKVKNKLSAILMKLQDAILSEHKIKGLQSLEIIRSGANIRGDVCCYFKIGIDGFLHKDVWIDCSGSMSPEEYFVANTPDVERYFNDPEEATKFVDKFMETYVEKGPF